MAEGEQQQQQQQAAGFLDGLPADLRANPAIAKHKDLASLAGEHANLQTLIGKKGVIPPGDKDPPEAWEKFYNQLGRPEKPEGYEFKKPADLAGYNEETAKWFRGVAHKHGLAARAAAALHDEFTAFVGAALGNRERTEAARIDEGTAALKAAWGVKYPHNLEMANRAVASVPGLAEELKGLKLDASPALAQALARLGEAATGEDKLIAGGRRPGGALTPEDAKAAAAKLRGEAGGDSKHPLMDKRHPEHDSAVKRLADLDAMAHPEGRAA